MDRLKGKVAVITGANSGVGEATALAFAKEGATVVISARRIEPLNAVADKIKAEGGTVLAVPTDISDKAACENLMDKAVEAFGKIDILVNNAGVLESGLKPIDRFNDDDLDRIINTNEKGTMYCMRAALKYMKEWASIVNVAWAAAVRLMLRQRRLLSASQSTQQCAMRTSISVAMLFAREIFSHL